MSDFRAEAFMGPRLDAIFGPAAPVGTGIDVNAGVAEMEARCKVFQFRPLRSPDVIVVFGTFFLAVAKAEGPDFGILLYPCRRLEAILGVQVIAGMEGQITRIVERYVGITPDADAVIAVIRRPRQ